MVFLKHLKKRRISQRGAGTKYYIDCSKYSENADSLQINTLIRNTNHVAILKAVFTDDNIRKKNKHIVVKIMRSIKSSEREYNIGQELYNHKLLGFIKYICFFSCYDTTNEDNTKITAQQPSTKLETGICQAEHTEKNLKRVIIMPYIQNECGIRSRAEDIHAYSEGRHRSPEEYGSVEDFIWNSENVAILKNILIQAVLALSVAYDTIGFLHGDLHLGNILFKETKIKTVTYSSSNLGEIPVETGQRDEVLLTTNSAGDRRSPNEFGGHKVVIMDFEKSEIRVDKTGVANVTFWNDIYVMLTRVNTLSPNHGTHINWENSEIIHFVKEARKRKYPCERAHILRLTEMMEKSEFEFSILLDLKYDAN